MPDIFYLISKWWKQILVVMGISLAAVAAIVFSLPQRYLSQATALPASTILTDKAGVFSDNIEQLYSSLGNPDDLDRMIGTARLDTLYIAVANSFNLWDHYRLKETGADALYRSATILKKYTRVEKSEYGELKVKVWDTDKGLAPQLANELLEQLNAIYKELQNENNKQRLKSLKGGRDKLLASADSMKNQNLFMQQLQQYERLIGEYQLMADANPAALLIVERARASEFPDKPKRVLIMVATFVLSLLFAILLALILERRKRSES